jgi:hypothetical protein
MRKLKYELFNGWSPSKNLCDFINEHNIKQNDILKIVHSGVSDLTLFYYVVE